MIFCWICSKFIIKLIASKFIILIVNRFDTFTRIFFYKKPRTRYPQTNPNLRNFKNYKKKGILT